MTNITDKQLDDLAERIGLNRRSFLKFCTGVAATLGLSSTAGIKMAHAVAQQRRPSVIWLSGQECTGCIFGVGRVAKPAETRAQDRGSL